MESLTYCQANRTRVGVRTVRRDTARPAMNHSLPVKPTGPEWNGSEKRHSWTCHGITHKLSSQQDQSWSENSEKGHS